MPRIHAGRRALGLLDPARSIGEAYFPATIGIDSPATAGNHRALEVRLSRHSRSGPPTRARERNAITKKEMRPIGRPSSIVRVRISRAKQILQTGNGPCPD